MASGGPSEDADGAASAHENSSWHRLTEPLVLFPILGVVLLALLWTTTVNLVRIEQAGAREAARALTLEVTNTYEAQVVRALREIDQALALVRYAHDGRDAAATLEELEARGLLPPGLLFVVSIVDDGTLSASTRAESAPSPGDVEQASAAGELGVGRPRFDDQTGQWWLDFTRSLPQDASGRVSVSVDADYFVSGYEATLLGQRGVLGLLGEDGSFRVRRSGADVFYDGAADYETLVADPFAEEPEVRLEDNAWDGVLRYVSARSIYGFPLAVVAGVSESEQLAPAQARVQTYLRRSAFASAVIVALLTLLGRLSWQLQKSRHEAMQEQVAHARRVEYLAFHDGLTGLPNRSFFSKLLSQHILEARRYGHSVALMFVDLDRFKVINDTLGHDAGDQLLKEVAARLKAAVRDSDIVARLGGDEFVVLLPRGGGEEELATVARKVLDAVRRKYVLSGQELRITLSIGIAAYPHDGEDEESLMKHADVAMYHAKEEGRNNFQFYSESLGDSSLERLSLEASLRHAVENGELRLYYQAKRDLRSGSVTGVEALLRWQHPDLGLVAPMQFIPLAEESGLIVPIGKWVLENACRQNVAWIRDGHPPVSMAVNLSARQFTDDHLIDDVTEALEQSGMDPALLELEITESMLMRDIGRAVEILTALKHMDVRIAIDDFGTGYSSLSSLKQFPLDTIKIDGSFIHDVATSAESKGLTEAIIAVGRTLSLTVIAEGVESEEQVSYLREHACDEFQGFYLNTPVPAEEFTAVLSGMGTVSGPRSVDANLR